MYDTIPLSSSQVMFETNVRLILCMYVAFGLSCSTVGIAQKIAFGIFTGVGLFNAVSGSGIVSEKKQASAKSE